MKLFLIDNNIDGILSALFYSFVEKIIPDDVVDKRTYQPRIDALSINIPTEKEKAERVKTALFKYGGDDIIAHLKVCLLSCEKNALLIAFNYAHLTLKLRKDVCDMLNEKVVLDFSYTIQKVLHERHILLGFIRFQESSHGVLYAKINPDNDVCHLLAPHFLKRLGAIPFVIHDIKRKKVAISNGKSIRVQTTDLPANFKPSQYESSITELWRKYFRAVNIKERKNPRLQANYFPHRYRKYCFETWE